MQKKCSPFAANFRQGLISGKKMFIILCILQTFGLPAITALGLKGFEFMQKHEQMVLQAAYDKSYYNDTTYYAQSNNILMFTAIATIIFFIASLAGILCASNSFHYLHKKNETDKIMSLPIKNDHRFLSDFLSGFLVYFIPYLWGIVLTVIVLLVKGDTVRILFDMTGLSSAVLLQCLIAAALTMLMLYTLTVFVTICCGNTIEVLMYSVLVNAVIPLFVFILTMSLYSDITGIHYLQETMPLLMKTSPFGGLVEIYETLISYFTTSHTFLSYSEWIISYIFVTAILFAAAFLLNRKRKAEDVSKPFVFSVLYYIFVIAVTMSVFMVFKKENSSLAGIAVSLIIFVILYLIKERRSKSVKKAVFSFTVYAASILMTFCIMAIGKTTEGFGAKQKLPDSSSVKYITINLPELFTEYDMTNEHYDIIINDSELIEQVISMHSEILEMINNSDNPNMYSPPTYHLANKPLLFCTFSDDEIEFTNYHGKHENDLKTIFFTYYTKSGKTITRYYYVPEYTIAELTINILMNENVRNSIADNFEKNINESEFIGSDKYEKGFTIYAPGSVSPMLSQLELYKKKITVKYDEQIFRELSDSFRKDIQNMTKDELLDLRTLCYINAFHIPTSFTETINTLKKYNYNTETLQRTNIEEDIYDSLKNSSSSYKFGISKVSYTEDVYGIDMKYASGYDSYIPQYIIYLDSQTIDTITKIISVSEKYCYTDEDCYILCKPDFYEYRIIPSEYSYLVDELIASSMAKELKWVQNVSDQ